MLIVGGYSAAAPELRDLSGTSLTAAFSGLGSSALTLTGYPGVVYDEINDLYIVAYNADGVINLLTVNAASLFVARPALSGSKPVARQNGIHNAIQYVPELRGLVVANRHAGNVYFMRTA
jgi:hypothetical protein